MTSETHVPVSQIFPDWYQTDCVNDREDPRAAAIMSCYHEWRTTRLIRGNTPATPELLADLEEFTASTFRKGIRKMIQDAKNIRKDEQENRENENDNEELSSRDEILQKGM